MADFLQSLRAAGIFNPQGGGGNLLGPPDFNSSGNVPGMPDVTGLMKTIMRLRESQNQLGENRQYRQAQFQNDMNLRNQFQQRQALGQATGEGQLANIAGANARPMNVRYYDDDKQMTDYQRAQIAIQRAGLEQKGAIAQAKDVNTDEDRAIRQQRANVYDRVNNLSNADKQDLIARARAGDIQAQGALDIALEHERQSGRSELARMNNAAQAANQYQRDAAAMERTEAEIKGRTNVETMRQQGKAGEDMLPTQQRVRAGNRARQYLNENPEMAEWITFDAAGNPTLTAPSTGGWNSSGPSLDQWNRARQFMYNPPGDINLPSQGAPVTSVAPTAPTTKSGSRYKVTIGK